MMPVPVRRTTLLRLLACLGLLGGLLAMEGGVLPAPAQSVTYGLRAGGAFSSFRGDVQQLTTVEEGSPESTARLGHRAALHVGGFVRVGLADWLAVQPELQYVQKGATLDATIRYTDPQTNEVNPLAEVEQTSRLNYLQLPVLARVRVPGLGSFQPSVILGPSFGVNLRSETETNFDSRVDDLEDEHMTVDTDTPETEWGAVVGGAVAYRLSSGQAVSLDVRYNAGITDVTPEEGNVSIQNEVISVGLGYTFSL